MGIIVLGANRIELISKSRLVSSRHQPCTRGAAIRCRNITARESDSTLRDRIDMGRRYLRIPLASKLSIPKVVGDQQDDIGARRSPSCADSDRG